MISRTVAARSRLLAGAAFGALALALAPGAQAAERAVKTAPADPTPPTDPREAQLERLEAEVQALSAEVRDLRSQLATTNTQIATTNSQLASASSEIKKTQAAEKKVEDNLPKVAFANGRPTISSPDGKFKVALRTLVQFDAAHYDVSPLTASNNLSSGADFRRARLGLDFTAYGDWNGAIWADFGGRGVETPVLNQAWIEYAGWKTKDFAARLRIGAWSTPTNLEDGTGAAEQLFPERAAVSELQRGLAGGDGRSSVGAFFNGKAWYFGGVLTGDVVGAPAAAEFGEQKGYIVRAAIDPIHGKDYDVHIGANVSGIIDPANTSATPGVPAQAVRLRERPETSVDNNSIRLVDTGNIASDGLTSYGLEGGASWGPLYVAGEWTHFDVSRTSAGSPFNPSFSGWYVQGSWTLTGERRVWSSGNGGFSGIRPRNNFDPAAGNWGALELAGRYDVLNLDDHAGVAGAATPLGGIRGGEQKVTSVGLNWYPNAVFKFQLDFQNVDVNRLSAAGVQIGENVKIYTLRSQFAF
jgi:phosphate-selective porin OprO/OprP